MRQPGHALAGIGLCLAATVIVAVLQGAGAQAKPPASDASGGVPVQVTKATRQDVPVLLHAIGTVQAYQSVLVRARVDGTLVSVNFQEGQEVQPGDLLAQIDPRPYQATLDQALAKKAADQAQLANAKLDLQRYSELARSSFASRQSVDTQSAMVRQLQATIEGDDATIDAARLNLEFTHITSPIQGRAGLRQIDPGNLVHANDTQGIVTITQIHPIALIFTLPQDDLPQVQAAMHARTLPVSVYTGDDKTKLSEGQLQTIDNTIDQATGTFRLKAVFANTDDHLWPGQFVNAHLLVDTLHGVTAVPSAAVQHGPAGLYVYVVKPDSTVAMQPVEVKQDDGHVAVIAKGVTEGQTVVVAGQSKLQDGSHVAPRPAVSGS